MTAKSFQAYCHFGGAILFAGIEPEEAQKTRASIEARLHILTSEPDEPVLRDACFSEVSWFYTGLPSAVE